MANVAPCKCKHATDLAPQSINSSKSTLRVWGVCWARSWMALLDKVFPAVSVVSSMMARSSLAGESLRILGLNRWKSPLVCQCKRFWTGKKRQIKARHLTSPQHPRRLQTMAPWLLARVHVASFLQDSAAYLVCLDCAFEALPGRHQAVFVLARAESCRVHLTGVVSRQALRPPIELPEAWRDARGSRQHRSQQVSLRFLHV